MECKLSRIYEVGLVSTIFPFALVDNLNVRRFANLDHRRQQPFPTLHLALRGTSDLAHCQHRQFHRLQQCHSGEQWNLITPDCVVAFVAWAKKGYRVPTLLEMATATQWHGDDGDDVDNCTIQLVVRPLIHGGVTTKCCTHSFSVSMCKLSG